MSYRNPRWCPLHLRWLHRDNPTSVLLSTGSYSTSAGVEKTYNRRRQSKSVTTNNIVHTQQFHPMATAAGQLVSGLNKPAIMDRIIVADHNGYGTYRSMKLPVYRTNYGTGLYLNRKLWDGFNSDDGECVITFPNGALDLELGDGVGLQAEEDLIIGAGSAVLELGDIFYTQMLQPTTGIAHMWQDDDEANLMKQEMVSGNVYTVEQGPVRRVWQFEHRGVSEADLNLYRYILAQCDYGRHPLWFDGPDSGDPYTDLDYYTSVPTNAVGCTAGVILSVGTGWYGMKIHEGGSGTYNVQLTSTDAGVSSANLVLPQGYDVRNHYLEFQVDFLTGAGGSPWLTVDTDLQIRLFRSTKPGLLTYVLGTQVINSPNVKCMRFVLDLDDPTHIYQQSGSFVTPDLSDIDRIQVVADHTVIGQATRFGAFRLRRKDAIPKYVEVLDIRKRMDSANPGYAPSYTINATLREVLS